MITLGLIGWGIATRAAGVISLGHDSDSVRLDVDWHCMTVEDAKAVRQQALGYPDDGSIVLPFVWDEDPAHDGFYAIESMSVITNNQMLNGALCRGSFQLRRVARYSSPAIEILSYGARRPHAAGAAGSITAWSAYPSTWQALDIITSDGTSTPTGSRNVTTDLSMRVLEDADLFGTTLIADCRPEHFYDGAVMLHSGPADHVVVGKQLAWDPDYWALDNGLVRISSSSSANAMFDLQTRLEDGSGWAANRRTLMINTDTHTTGTGGIPWGGTVHLDTVRTTKPSRIEVMRNTPEVVSVALTYPRTGSTGSLMVLLSLRRGSRFVLMTVSSQRAAKWGLTWVTGWQGVGSTITNPGGSSSFGIVDTADADGQKNLVLSGTAMAASSAGDLYLTTAAKLAEIGVGAVVGSAATCDTASQLVSQFLAATTENSRVVSR